MNLPEGLSLQVDGKELTIVDAQEIVHVWFGFGPGDPSEWSELIVHRTCSTLLVTTGYSLDDDADEELSVGTCVRVWHRNLGVGVGDDMPWGEPDMDTEIT